ncbi:TadE/TadG family type IV pilus assembly protein [Aliivibrio logei]|uniref:TadE/TadG family type IV pilus assembly protein n=1 Tax=Aliivibrio logei TaxID=688 RepID=UPI0003A8D284|nr:TadE/TadG family type IV pilus assembly protein [Aliivibrio logei]
MKLRRHQKGHAAILFAMMIPALFGIFTLASDGARAIQTKARIEDAAEVATLAVSAHNDPNQDYGGGGSPSSANQQIVTDYINAYISDVDSINEIKVYKRNCEEIPECKAGLAVGEPRYFEHEVGVTTSQKSWFPGNDAIVGMGDSFSTSGHSLARKYQSEAVDVMFAADFSGSMGDRWTGGNKKYEDLIDIIDSISKELQKFNDLEHNDNDNTMGITAYNEYTYSQYSGSSGGWWGDDCYLSQAESDGFWGGVSISKTIEELWNEKSKDHCNNSYNSGQFNDIPLTSNFDVVNQDVSRFWPKGGTSSYQALIRGAQLLKYGTNSRRLLIVLSDGMDTDNNLTSSLVNKGMCRDIQQGLESDKTLDNRPIRAQMAVIGFDYEPSENQALKDCVGEENVYKAENADDILNTILELISEEIGHLK